uniref:Uncharacterized protein n=1 Tax=Pararge aegeria TaxID=116150 RepID=S4NMY9_9NEOP
MNATMPRRQQNISRHIAPHSHYLLKILRLFRMIMRHIVIFGCDASCVQCAREIIRIYLNKTYNSYSNTMSFTHSNEK